MPFCKRRGFLFSSGLALALPPLESLATLKTSASNATPRRMVFVCGSLGFYGPSFFPNDHGENYQLSEYLKLLNLDRSDFSVFSGLSHPDQAGADGHSSQMTWLTSAPHPGLGGFRNTISIDQVAAEALGPVTRFPSLSLSTDGSNSQSYTSSGVMIGAEWRPSVLFENLFLSGNQREISKERQRLASGRSILDGLAGQTREMNERLGKADQLKLGEYFESLRKTERDFQLAGEWLDRPKPEVDAEIPNDVAEANDLIGRTELLMELIPLILQTDSTRVLTVLIQGRNDVPIVDGVTMDHHNLSHHGQDDSKIGQLRKIESAVMKSVGKMLADLKSKEENDGALLDHTSVLLGSNLGNANSHDWRNLPVLLAGGRYNHGKHVAFDAEENLPLANLFVRMCQESGLPIDQFGSSTGSLDW